LHRPVVNVVELNPHTPQPFVMSEVAVCLRDAIRAAGYASSHLVNAVDPAAFSIILNPFPEQATALPGLDTSRCLVFDPGQLASGSASPSALELPLVPSRGLVTPASQPKSVDVLVHGPMSDRRNMVLRQLSTMGLSTEVASGAYGHELAPALHRARLVLHVHSDERDLFAVTRVLQPAALGVAFVCENCVFPPMNDWSRSGVLFAPYEQLAQACADLLGTPAEMARRGESMRAFARTIDFATPFSAVLHALQARGASPSSPSAQPVVALAADEPADGPLSDADIEALLVREGAMPPEAGQPLPEIDLVQRAPEQSRYGRWIVLLLTASVVLGAVNLVLSFRR
jgi:hypothetical protein